MGMVGQTTLRVTVFEISAATSAPMSHSPVVSLLYGLCTYVYVVYSVRVVLYILL